MARTHYVRGQHFLSLRTKPSLTGAVREFKRALDVEPGWFEPYLGIATSYLALSANELSSQEGYPRARAAAAQVLKLEPDQSAALTILGFVHAFYDSAWTQSLTELDRAIQTSPQLPEARYYRGVVMMNLGNFETAIQEITQAAEWFRRGVA